MKILWIVNTIFPYPAKKLGIEKTNFGGWLNSLAKEVVKKNKIKLAIATVYNGKNIIEFNDGEVIYYLIPGSPAIKYDNKLEKYWKEITNTFNPDLAHIHGTEYAHGLAFRNACPNIKVITAIQGLVSAIANVYYANINYCDIVKNITFRDIVKRDSIFAQKRKFEQRGKNEIELIKKSDFIIGRTSWDYANCKEINKDLVYYHCNETLRSSFYNKEWNIENIDRHSIFCSQAGYPIKGLHYMLSAIYILKKQYPDIKLFVAGPKITDCSNIVKKIKLGGYAKYIIKLIRKYNIQDQVIFTGILNEEEMLERLLKTHVFSSNSIIENESNSLSEASLVGVPAVASYVGGIPDRIDHGKSGFMYPYSEPAMLAEYISQIFNNDELAKELSYNSKNKYLYINDKKTNVNIMLDIYDKIIKVV